MMKSPTFIGASIALLMTLMLGCAADSPAVTPFEPSAQPRTEAAPRRPRTSQNVNIARHLDNAQRFLEQGLDDSALAAFGLALARNPRLTEAHMGMGQIYLRHENYPLASNAFERAARYAPHSFEAHYYLGTARRLMGHFDTAMQAYARAAAIEPDDFDTNLNLAGLYLMHSRAEDAMSHAQRAVQLQDNSPGAWANLAAAYSLLGYDDDAVQAYRTVMELDEPSEHVMLGLADAHLRLGNFDRATFVLESLVRQWPGVLAHERRGYAYFKLRRFEDALASYRAALALDENDVASLNGVGVSLMTLYLQSRGADPSYKNEAINVWRQSLKLQPKQPQIIDLLARYEKLWTTRDIRQRQHD